MRVPKHPVPAWWAALPLNRDEEYVDVLDLNQPRPPVNEYYDEDYHTRRINRLTPVRIHHYTSEGFAVVEFS